MNDFEKFESELNELYTGYVLKFRILSYLEKELEGHFRNQREKVQVNTLVGGDFFSDVCLGNALGSISTIQAIDQSWTDGTGAATVQ